MHGGRGQRSGHCRSPLAEVVAHYNTVAAEQNRRSYDRSDLPSGWTYPSSDANVSDPDDTRATTASDLARDSARRPGGSKTRPPLPLVTAFLDAHASGRALDIACGRGRHLAALDSRGWSAVGIDISAEALDNARLQVPAAQLVRWDVEGDGLPPDLGGPFDVVLTTYFLYRPLIPALFSVLRPGGHWLLETFHIRNHIESGHPRRRAFCLEQGEAARLAAQAGFKVQSCIEGEAQGVWTTRMVAQRGPTV